MEAYRQLNNTTYYTPLPNSIQLEKQILIRNIVNKLYDKTHITVKQITYLDGPDEPRLCLLYLFPKIHKPPVTWTVPSVVPVGRPIVSDCVSETYKKAVYIDHFINPLSKLHPSYVKDIYEFVNFHYRHQHGNPTIT